MSRQIRLYIERSLQGVEVEDIPKKRDYFIQWRRIKELEDSTGFHNTVKNMDSQVENLTTQEDVDLLQNNHLTSML